VPSAPPAVWLAHQAAIAGLSDWRAQGRVAIRNQTDGWNAAFDWAQTGATWRLRLRGPFGQGGAELHSDGDLVWLQREDRPPLYARDIDRLLAEETGWQLPVRGLRDWLRGIPVAGRAAQLHWDDRGLLQTLQQDGWDIAYRQYREVGGQRLPDRLQLSRDALRVKLVVDEWQLP
jgi:outer membrane lipoprotein LolB